MTRPRQPKGPRRPSPTGQKLSEFARAVITSSDALAKLSANVKTLASHLAAVKTSAVAPPTPASAVTAMPTETVTDTQKSARQFAKRLATEVVKSVAAELSNASMGNDISDNLARGAEAAVGGTIANKAISKLVPSLLTTGAASTIAAAASSTAGGMAAASGATAAMAPAATAASSAMAGLATTLGAVLLPLTAIAAAAGVVYVAVFKWQELPIWAKLLLLAVSPLVVVIRALALGFHAASTAVSVITAPFRLAAGAANALVSGIKALPSAIVSAVAATPRLAAAIGSGLATAAKQVGQAVSTTIASIRTLASGTASAIRGLSDSLQTAGKWTAMLGGSLVAAAGLIVAPAQQAASAYADLGTELYGLSAEYGITAERAAGLRLASDLTGRSIADLVEILPAGSTAAAVFERQAQRLGLSMTDSAADGADRLTLAMATLKQSGQGFWATLGSAVAPAIRQTTELMASAVQIATRWVSEHKPLIATAFKVATYVALAGTGIASIGGALATAGTLLTPFTAALAAIAAGLALVEWRTGTAASVWAAYGDSLRRVYATVLDYGGRIWAYAKSVVEGVTNAIRGGNLDLAVTIALTGAQVAWAKGLSTIATATDGTLGAIFASLAAGRWSAAAEAAMAGLQIAWLTGVNWVASTWDTISAAGDTAMGAIEKGWLLMIEMVKSGLAGLLSWTITNVFRPLVSWIEEHDTLFGIDSGIGEKARKGFGKLLDMQGALERSRKTPEQLAADQTAVDTRTAERSQARQTAADDARRQRDQQIVDLQARLAALQAQGTAESDAKAAALQARLTAAQAEAARAAEEARLRGDQLSEAQRNTTGATLPQMAANANVSGMATSSSAAALAMFGGGGGSPTDSILRQQLAEERRTARAIEKIEERQARYPRGPAFAD